MTTSEPRTWYRWDELKRHELKAMGPDAVVVIPLGSIEQHGPFLPTGTDIFMATRSVVDALTVAAPQSQRPFILADVLRIGNSAHHVQFGGTITLPPQLMIEVLIAVMLSMVESSGVKRIVIVNGHGGNEGVIAAASSEAGTRADDLTIATLEYWQFAPQLDRPAPGHAGWFETSLVLATRPELVAEDRDRPDRSSGLQPGRGIWGKKVWANIDGFTDEPVHATREEGEQLVAGIALNLGEHLARLASEL